MVDGLVDLVAAGGHCSYAGGEQGDATGLATACDFKRFWRAVIDALPEQLACGVAGRSTPRFIVRPYVKAQVRVAAREPHRAAASTSLP
jgi:hypothetical protein